MTTALSRRWYDHIDNIFADDRWRNMPSAWPWLAAQWATLSMPQAPVVPEPGPVLVLDEAA
jgi:hypothetical protein